MAVSTIVRFCSVVKYKRYKIYSSIYFVVKYKRQFSWGRTFLQTIILQVLRVQSQRPIAFFHGDFMFPIQDNLKMSCQERVKQSFEGTHRRCISISVPTCLNPYTRVCEQTHNIHTERGVQLGLWKISYGFSHEKHKILQHVIQHMIPQQQPLLELQTNRLQSTEGESHT